jgi:hypothetical protein
MTWAMGIRTPGASRKVDFSFRDLMMFSLTSDRTARGRLANLLRFSYLNYQDEEDRKLIQSNFHTDANIGASKPDIS